jgi:hypothetical protein
MRIAALVLVLGLASGCTTLHIDDFWAKPNVGIQQATLDDWECKRLAADAPTTPDLYIGGAADAVRVFLDQQAIERAYAACMSTRGYERQRT